MAWQTSNLSKINLVACFFLYSLSIVAFFVCLFICLVIFLVVGIVVDLCLDLPIFQAI